MAGTSSPGDELTGGFGNELEAISIEDCGPFRVLAENLTPGNPGLLQQNRHELDLPRRLLFCRYPAISGIAQPARSKLDL